MRLIHRDSRHRLDRHPTYHTLQRIPWVGSTFAAIFATEIDDAARLGRPARLACWAEVSPRDRESKTVVHRSHITRQGTTLVRWGAVEAVRRFPVDTKLRPDRERIAA